MQAITCMKSLAPKKPDTATTRSKILEAAMRVFVRDGLHKAATRVIAEEAGVNEVTLFRHFQNKEGLLSAVMLAAVQSQANGDGEAELVWTGSLKQDLLKFAKGLFSRMVRDEAFLRTMIGEANRHPDLAKKVVMEAVRPARTRFIANLEEARKAGKVRRGIDLGVAVDVFTASLLGGMLRITAGCSEGYTEDQYVATCVDIFAAGIAPAARS